MRAYEEYSSTQEICFPMIPAHWNMWKVKHLFAERIEKGFPEEQLLVASQNHGVIPKREYETRTVEATKDLHLLKLVKQGDFVISLRSFQGGIEYAHCQGIISPAYTIMIPQEEISPAYFRLLAKSFPFIEILKQCVTGIREGQNIDYNKLKNRHIPLPSREEQDAIVHFLDAKCAKIDSLIKLKERQIELLNEKKQNIINQAVTKGLDPHAPMKDSGVDWIGEIPEGWEVKRLLTFATFQNGISEAGEFFTSGSPFVTYGDVYNNYELPTEAGGVAKSNSKQQEVYSVKRGDIFLTRTSETIEEIGFSSVCMKDIEQAVFSGFLIRVRPQEGVLHPEYSKYFFRSTAVREYFSSAMNIVIRASLGQSLLKNLPVILPPLDQQKKIAIHLEISSEKITRSIQFVESNIFLLKEYKQKLISDVVTGKCNVGNN